MIVRWATKLRGFLRHLSEHTVDVRFENCTDYFEVSDWKSKVKSKLIRSKIFDYIGLFQVIEICGEQCDCYGSFNRFLKTDKPYFIYLENPTALYHYCLDRIKYPMGKSRFKKCLHDKKLKYIVCMSDACRDTFVNINMNLPSNVKIKTAYPYIPTNKHISEALIYEKSKRPTLKCLYCVQGKRFATKGGLDVVRAFDRLIKGGMDAHLTVITKISELESAALREIKQCKNLSLFDFSFQYDELEEIYAETNVLIHPTSDDSSALTILEAMKGGCAIISTNLYAIPEMVENGGNGFLIEPKFRIFDKDNLPNPQYWARSKKIRAAKICDSAFEKAIEECIKILYSDREKLHEFSKRSLELANTKFGEAEIASQWSEVWADLKGSTEYET